MSTVKDVVEVVAEEEVVSLDDPTPARMITLISRDNEPFTISAKACSLSGLIATAIDVDDSVLEIPVPNVSANILTLVVKYMSHHDGKEPAEIRRPLQNKAMASVCHDPWDAQFIDAIAVDKQQLYDLILAANYMDINRLLHLGCAKVAATIKGEPLENIRDLLEVKKPAQ